MSIEDILLPNDKGVIIGQGWSPQCENYPSLAEDEWGVLKTTAIQPGLYLDGENKKLPVNLEPRIQHEVKPGDLLMTCAGPRNRCGVACLVKKTRRRLLISGKMYRFRINGEYAIPEYVEAFLLSHKAWKEIDKMKTGISDSGLNLTHDRFKKLLIPIPSIFLQRRIVSKIEELFSELDKGVEQLKTAQQQLKTYRQAVLKWAFEGRLTNKSIKDGELPEGWEWVKLKDLATDITDGDHQAPPKSDNGIPFITISDIDKSTNKIDFSNTFKVSLGYFSSLKNNRKPQIGDILFTVTGSFGIPIFIDFVKEFCFQRHIGLIRPVESVNRKWLYFLLQSPLIFSQAKDMATGTAQKTVSLNSLRNFDIPFCCAAEQLRIVNAVEYRLSIADSLQTSVDESLRKADSLRQSILKNAFEGKLAVGDKVETISKTYKAVPLERKVLAAKIIYLLHDDRNFGLTKFQKLLYLVENFAEVSYETNFIQETAGPYDKEFTTAFRREMQEKDWLREEQKGRITKFISGDNIDSLINDYGKYFREKSAKVDFIIQQLKGKSTHEAELIATLYAVWNNRLIKKRSIKVDLLVEDFFNWSPKKKEEFQQEEVMSTFKWMKKSAAQGCSLVISINGEVKNVPAKDLLSQVSEIREEAVDRQ